MLKKKTMEKIVVIIEKNVMMITRIINAKNMVIPKKITIIEFGIGEKNTITENVGNGIYFY